MLKQNAYDAIVVGSGPNGLAAAITLAQAGLSVAILEAKETIGGGMRSAELTLPGFIHDICSAIHPLGIASPFFQKLPLSEHGLEWIHPQAPLAHPYDDGTAAFLERSIEATAETLGIDSFAYKKLIKPLAADWDILSSEILVPPHFPRHPIVLGRFGFYAIQSAIGLAKRSFESDHARAFFAGLAAHSVMPLDWHLTGGFGLILAILGHNVGWPMPRGGSQRLADALGSFFQSLGGKIMTGVTVECLNDLPKAKIILFDVTPRQLLKIVKQDFSSSYRKKLENYRYGPGVFKIDWALSQPIPWKARECARAGTVHLGGTLKEIVNSESEVWEGKHPEKPFVLLAQQSLFDQTRAPAGKQTAWAYCHVPHATTLDMTDRIEAQIERFAPGFRDCILARRTRSAAEIEQYNPNCVGGDITGGVQDMTQLFTRPTARLVPYSTPIEGIYICSSSTPPGAGVHGLCGYYAAQAALKHAFR